MRTNNAYKLPTYISNKALIEKKIELKLVEATETVSPGDREMSFKEKVVMNALVWVPFTYVAYLFLDHLSKW